MEIDKENSSLKNKINQITLDLKNIHNLPFRDQMSILVKESKSALDSSVGKDIIIFLGNTGSGKSTLINFLQDPECLIVDKNTAQKLKGGHTKGGLINVKRDRCDLMIIGHTTDSMTFLPKGIYNKELNGVFFDLPGFSDSRGGAIALVNGCLIKNIIEKAASVRVVFVASCSEYDSSRAEAFKLLKSAASHLFRDSEILSKSSCLVVTKTDPDLENKEEVIKSVNTKIDLKPWIQNNRIEVMSQPYDCNLNIAEKDEILKMILSLEGKKIPNVAIDAIYNGAENYEIMKMCREEIRHVLNNFVEQSKIYLKQKTYNLIELQEKRKSFKELAQNIIKMSQKSDTILLISQVSDRFLDETLKEEKSNIQINIMNLVKEVDDLIKLQITVEVKKLLHNNFERMLSEKKNSVNINDINRLQQLKVFSIQSFKSEFVASSKIQVQGLKIKLDPEILSEFDGIFNKVASEISNLIDEQVVYLLGQIDVRLASLYTEQVFQESRERKSGEYCLHDKIWYEYMGIFRGSERRIEWMWGENWVREVRDVRLRCYGNGNVQRFEGDWRKVQKWRKETKRGPHKGDQFDHCN